MSNPLSQPHPVDLSALQSQFGDDLRAARGIVGNAREPVSAQIDFVRTLGAENELLARFDTRNRAAYEENSGRFAEAADALKDATPLHVQFARAVVIEAAAAYRLQTRALAARAVADAERTDRATSLARWRAMHKESAR